MSIHIDLNVRVDKGDKETRTPPALQQSDKRMDETNLFASLHPKIFGFVLNSPKEASQLPHAHIGATNECSHIQLTEAGF